MTKWVTPVAAGTAAPSPSPSPSDQAQALQFAAEWFNAGTEAADAQAMRRFYADSVRYYERGTLPWSAVAADKAAYLRRWPLRSYQLDQVQLLSAADGSTADDELQVAMHFHWRVERDGRWRRGLAVTVLALRQVDGQWRVVAERGG